MSPTSERTVLLWGSRWWLAGKAEPLAFQNFTHAVEVLAAALLTEGRRVAVRLVFQPDSLASSVVACPNGNRHAVHLALSAENPALEDPERAWGYEPILPISGEYSTILHQETDPVLFGLVGALAERGVDLVGAWPLATFLHALPGDWSESGAEAVLAVGGDRAVAYHHPAEGTREVKAWEGSKAAESALAWLGALPASPGSKLLVGAQAPAEEDWAALALGDALASGVILPRNHPAQLIPPAVASPVERVAVVAAVIMLLAGGWLVVGQTRAYWAGLQQAAVEQAEITRLTGEVAHLRTNASEIAQLRERLAGRGAGAPIADFLSALGRGLAGRIAINSVQADANGFEVGGFVAEDAAGQFAGWQRRLADARWLLETPVHAGARFTLKGRFK